MRRKQSTVTTNKKQKVPFVPKLHVLNEREKSLLQLIELTRQTKIRPGFRYYLDTVRLYKTKKSPVLELPGGKGSSVLVRGPSSSHEHRQYVDFLLHQQAYIQERTKKGQFPLSTFDLQRYKQKKQEGMFIPSKREIKRFQDLESDTGHLLESVLCFYIVEYKSRTLIPVFLPHFLERAGEMLHNKYNDLFNRRPVCQEHFFYLAFESALLHRLLQLKDHTFQKFFASPRTTNTDELQVKNKPVIFMMEHKLETPESVLADAESGEWLGTPLVVVNAESCSTIQQKAKATTTLNRVSLDSMIELSDECEWIPACVVTRSMGPLLPCTEKDMEQSASSKPPTPVSGSRSQSATLLSIFQEEEFEWCC